MRVCIIAEQIPAKLIPDVIKNTAVKIMHRLPAADDREAVGVLAAVRALDDAGFTAEPHRPPPAGTD